MLVHLHELKPICNFRSEIAEACSGDVEIAEALVILEGLKLAAEVVLSPLLIKSDCKNVVNFVLKGISSRGELDLILGEIEALMEQNNQTSDGLYS